MPYFSRILRIHVSDRVDLNVSSTVKVCLQEGLDVGIGAKKQGLRSRGQVTIPRGDPRNRLVVKREEAGSTKKC